MRFRLKAFSLHLLTSITVLTVTLGGLYLGWYRWPGWYLTHVAPVVAVMAGVDVVLGPFLTLLIANPAKARRELARDIGLIAVVQLTAFVYGTIQLWNGRPLYYAYSVNSLSVVQAYDLDAVSLANARKQNSEFAPHWYSLPRWVWAPLPEDSDKANKIIQSAIAGGSDVTAMPDHYRPWNAGLSDMQGQLKAVGDIKFFSADEKTLLKQRLAAAGLSSDKGIALTGRSRPLLAVVDPKSLRIVAFIEST
jgi:hypothetical protein